MSSDPSGVTACDDCGVFVLVDWRDATMRCMACRARVGLRPESASTPPAMTCAGVFRVYFNRHGAAGLPWCVAPEDGSWELAVATVGILVTAIARYQPKSTPDDEDGRPSAWFEVDGRMTVRPGGHAAIEAR